MKYRDLRDFIRLLEERGQLKRISQEIDPYLEMTEIADRTYVHKTRHCCLKTKGSTPPRISQPVR